MSTGTAQICRCGLRQHQRRGLKCVVICRSYYVRSTLLRAPITAVCRSGRWAAFVAVEDRTSASSWPTTMSCCLSSSNPAAEPRCARYHLLCERGTARFNSATSKNSADFVWIERRARLELANAANPYVRRHFEPLWWMCASRARLQAYYRRSPP